MDPIEIETSHTLAHGYTAYGVKAVCGNTMIELSHEGEGHEGDYRPDDPMDRPLYRFYVSRQEDGEWSPVDGASYCTQITCEAPKGVVKAVSRRLMANVHPRLEIGDSIQTVCEIAACWHNHDFPEAQAQADALAIDQATQLSSRVNKSVRL